MMSRALVAATLVLASLLAHAQWWNPMDPRPPKGA